MTAGTGGGRRRARQARLELALAGGDALAQVDATPQRGVDRGMARGQAARRDASVAVTGGAERALARVARRQSCSPSWTHRMPGLSARSGGIAWEEGLMTS
jgi:hypothetical protein